MTIKCMYTCPTCKKFVVFGYHDSTLCVIEKALWKRLELSNKYKI